MDVDDFLKGKSVVIFPSFWRRLSAFFIDLLILYFLVYETIFVSLIGRVEFPGFESGISSNLGSAFNGTFFVPEIFIWSLIFAGLLSWAYFALLEFSVGWTIGMRMLGLRVSGNPSFSRCLLRNSYILPFFPFTLFWVADPLFLIMRKRRLLEIVSSTDTIFDNK